MVCHKRADGAAGWLVHRPTDQELCMDVCVGKEWDVGSWDACR